MSALRPAGSGHVLIPLGASRSKHHLTPQTQERSNGSVSNQDYFLTTKITVLLQYLGMAPNTMPPVGLGGAKGTRAAPSRAGSSY
jgi:hypothetical protein